MATLKLIVPLFIVMIILTVFCSSNRPDPSPAATVGDEAITRGFVSYALSKIAADRNKQSERETIERVVANILIARAAEAVKLDRAAGFDGLVRAARAAAMRDFIRDEHGIAANDDRKLHELAVKTFGIAIPPVDWNAVLVRENRQFVPLGGKIPERPRASSRGREAMIQGTAAGAVTITSSALSITLRDLLMGLDDDAFGEILTGEADARAAILAGAVTDMHLPHLAKRLEPGKRALLDEIVLRAGENLLVEAYREHIGFEKISGGRASRVTYPVRPAEARAFYDANRAQFEEPMKIDVSHIRVRDYAEAERLHKKITADPSSFCELAAQHSIAPDARECGRIGSIVRNDAVKLPLYKEFGFTLSRPGQVSVPFTTPEGVEILRLNSAEKRLRAFEDPYTQKLIVEKMQPMKREAKLQETIEEMKKKHPVRIP